MAELLFANNAASTLANSISSGATSVTLASGGGALFPNPSAGQDFLATLVDAASGLINEIVLCTSVSGDTITITRAQEGTTAKAWNTGDFFSNFWTAGSANAMLQQGQAQQQSTNYAVDTGTASAKVISLSPAPTSMTQLLGAPVRFKVNVTDTGGGPTLNVNGLGAQLLVVVNQTGVELSNAGTFAAGKICEVIWDGTNFQFMGYVSEATAAQIKTGNDTVSPITSYALAQAMPGTLSATAGYQTFPNGLILQYGVYTTSTGNNETITLPITFPTAAVSVTVTSNENGQPGCVCSANFSSTAAFLSSVVNLAGTHQVGATVKWVAIGY